VRGRIIPSITRKALFRSWWNNLELGAVYNGKDALRLNPTIIQREVSGTTGVALVEVDEVP